MATVLYQANPSMFRDNPMLYLLLLILLLGSLAGIVVVMTGQIADIPQQPVAAGLLGVAVLVFLMMLGWYIRNKAIKLTVTEEDAVLEKGILSKSYNEIRLRDVRNVRIDQSLFDRMLGCGKLMIASAGSDTHEIDVKGLPRIKEVRRLIQERRGD